MEFEICNAERSEARITDYKFQISDSKFKLET
jgi:hypothetical protein